ncbi:hypothetical protein TSUD_80280 [Trifolium subterraneum]|uniref:Neprosin PEP catalytic domain-containing protein n=1 Tax=Trifolium subterraneum TaxID=3900 RepID=A0A2Z6M1E4_TRISU|nr:hypothetical protein TSUD_80280 [Trifolium subterraneum]
MGFGCGVSVLLVFCLWGVLISVSDSTRLGSSRQKLEVNKHLNRLNKAPIKTIQMRPNYHPEGLFEENKFDENKAKSSTPINQLWHANGMCSEGTIPIRRTKEEDVLRASSVKRYGRKKHRSIPKPRSADPDLSDAYQATGCYNLLCSGFIQVSSNIAMGASISPISSYRDSQYDISILIWKEAWYVDHCNVTMSPSVWILSNL